MESDMGLNNRIPPPLVALIFGVAMWFANGVLPALDMAPGPRLSLALLILSAGVFVCIAGVVSFRLAKTTVNPLKPETASSLVSSGIFQYSRNPMYLGFTLILFSWAVFLANVFLLPFALAYALYIQRFQILPEELAMEKLFGDEFESYKQKVRPWI